MGDRVGDPRSKRVVAELSGKGGRGRGMAVAERRQRAVRRREPRGFSSGEARRQGCAEGCSARGQVTIACGTRRGGHLQVKYISML